jgi:hypothetical protein
VSHKGKEAGKNAKVSHKGKDEARKKEVGEAEEDEEADETKVGSFETFNLPDDYVLLPMKHASNKGSGVRTFVFLLNFCVSIDFPNTTYPNFRVGGKVAGMGRGIPLQKTKLIAYLREMEVCIIQVMVGRIASTQLGPSCKEAFVFVEHVPTVLDL